MNVKSIATKAMVAAALAVTTIAPAFANNNNNQYLNQLAMQMYAQNQATSGLYNGYGAYGGYGAYNTPYAYGAGVGGTIPGAPLYGRNSVGAYGGGYGANVYGNAYNNYANRGVFNRHWHR